MRSADGVKYAFNTTYLTQHLSLGPSGNTALHAGFPAHHIPRITSWLSLGSWQPEQPQLSWTEAVCPHQLPEPCRSTALSSSGSGVWDPSYLHPALGAF